jgi:phage terminase Nu1 subunit (DNA packaging protein)
VLIGVEPLTAADMGRVLGITARQVRSLADRGHMVREGDDRYAVQASVRAYCAFLRAAAQGRGGDSAAAAAQERGRLARARAEYAETKNAIMRRDLVPAAEVEAEWSAILRTVRAGLLAVPSRCAARLGHLTAHDVAEIDAEVRAALTESGKTEP